MSVAAFYDECARLTKFPRQLEGYGARRERDCHYATAIAGFVRLPVRRQRYQSCGEHLAEFDWVYCRADSPPDLGHVIAPDTRVPNYTTEPGDAMELARAVGLQTVPVPGPGGFPRELIDYILAACDESIAKD